jgi:hypothetical protein
LSQTEGHISSLALEGLSQGIRPLLTFRRRGRGFKSECFAAE